MAAPIYEIKNTSKDSVIDVSTESRKVKVAISEMGSKDLDNDVIDFGAYTKTIAERGPNGAGLIWHLTDHNASLKNAVARFSELYVEGNKLVGVTDIPKTSWGNDVLEFYLTGNINQHSVGFRTIKREPANAGKPDEYNIIKEILLYEGSAVLWGANPNTPTLEAGKSVTKQDLDCINDLFANQKRMLKMFKDGNLQDSTFELMEIQLLQTQEKLKQYTTQLQLITPAAPDAPVPTIDLKGIAEVINKLNNTLKN